MAKPLTPVHEWVCPQCGNTYDSPLPILQVNCSKCSKDPTKKHAVMVPRSER